MQSQYPRLVVEDFVPLPSKGRTDKDGWYVWLHFCTDFTTFTRFTSFFYFFSELAMLKWYMATCINLDVNLSWSICIGLSILTRKFLWCRMFSISPDQSHLLIYLLRAVVVNLSWQLFSFFKCVLTWHCSYFWWIACLCLCTPNRCHFVSYCQKGLFIMKMAKYYNFFLLEKKYSW